MLKKILVLSGLFCALPGFGQEWNTLNNLSFAEDFSPGHQRLKVHDSTLYLIGSYRTPYIGGTWSMALSWDGIEFNQIGVPPDQAIIGAGNSLTTFAGHAYLGGSFTNLEGLAQADRIIRWDSAGR